MQLLDLTLPTLPENLALDEALLLAAENGQGGELLRLWEWPILAVVLGSGGQLAADVDEEACRTDAVPICRRSSGGGTVLLGSGCLLYTLILAYDRAAPLREIPTSYSYILERVAAALSGALPAIELAGTSDLAAGGRKFSGNAQQRKRTHLLHHGTLLYAFPIEQVGRYLKTPARQPEYRAGRGHAEFLCNLPLGVAELKDRLRAAWSAETVAADWPRELVRQLSAGKYTTEAWLRRR
jgi:lipoate-protein ligase A